MESDEALNVEFEEKNGAIDYWEYQMAFSTINVCFVRYIAIYILN